MALVVFLRGLNVGGHRSFRPTTLAKQLQHLDAVNIGATGILVIRRPVSRGQLRAEIARGLPFDAEIAICHGDDIVGLLDRDSFAGHPKAHRCGPFRKPSRSNSAISAAAPHEISFTGQVAVEGPRARWPVRIRSVPTGYESYQLPWCTGPGLRGASHNAELEYDHSDRQGAQCLNCSPITRSGRPSCQAALALPGRVESSEQSPFDCS